jgi:protein O-mannosyl-transferase
MVIIFVFLLFIFAARKKNRGLLFCLSWIIVPLLPVLYFPAFISEAVYSERYLYLPSVGLVIAVAILVRVVYQQKLLKVLTTPVIILSFTGILILCVSYTIDRNRAWKDNLSLWTDTLKKSPYSYTAHSNLGNLYYEKGFLDDAIREYRIALFLNPNYEDAQYNLSVVSAMREAVSSYKK